MQRLHKLERDVLAHGGEKLKVNDVPVQNVPVSKRAKRSHSVARPDVVKGGEDVGARICSGRTVKIVERLDLQCHVIFLFDSHVSCSPRVESSVSKCCETAVPP